MYGGDFLGPPHGTKPAAVIANKICLILWKHVGLHTRSNCSGTKSTFTVFERSIPDDFLDDNISEIEALDSTLDSALFRNKGHLVTGPKYKYTYKYKHIYTMAII